MGVPMSRRRTLVGSQLPQPSSTTETTKLLAGASRPAQETKYPVSLLLRGNPATKDALQAKLEEVQCAPLSFRPLSIDELKALISASPKDLEQVEAFVREHPGLSLVRTDAARRQVSLRGTLAALEALFGVQLEEHSVGGKKHLEYTGEISLPEPLAESVVGVLGLEHRPVVMRRLNAHQTQAPAGEVEPASDSDKGLTKPAYTPQQLAALYGFPPDTDGAGQTLCVIEILGGFWEDDLKTYFTRLGLDVPAITVVGPNEPAPREGVAQTMRWMYGPQQLHPAPAVFGASALTIEVGFDLQMAGAFANKAHLVAHFSQGVSIGAVTQQLWDILLDGRDYSVVTGSFGIRESDVSPLAAQHLDEVLSLFALRGISLVFPSGDYGAYAKPYSGTGQPDDIPPLDVYLPASSPHVISVGGTRLWSRDGRIVKEVAFTEPLGPPVGLMASGGGFSRFFPRPPWQASATDAWAAHSPDASGEETQRRGLPDLALSAHMFSGCPIRVAGVDGVSGGTSVSAPILAAFIVRANQALRTRLGYLPPVLYSERVARTFHDVTEGNNDITRNGGAYSATPGWDPLTGLGALRGEPLLKALAELTPPERREPEA